MVGAKTVLVTGASGNLGTRLARRLAGSEHRLRLMVHRTALAQDLADAPSPLTRDFVTIGRVSYCGDTSRMRRELVAELRYPTLGEGMGTL